MFPSLLMVGLTIIDILTAIFGPNVWVKHMIFPSLQCTIALYVRGIQIDEEGFALYFRDDSEVKVAQTGLYRGLDGIQEYSRILNPLHSEFMKDYVSLPENIQQNVEYLEYDYSNRQCVYRAFLFVTQFLNPETTTGITLPTYSLVKVFYDVQERYYPNLNIYIPPKYFSYWMSQFATDGGRSLVCNILRTYCMAGLHQR